MKNAKHPYKNIHFLSKQSREPLLNVPFIIIILIVFCFCIYLISQYFFSHQLYIKSFKFFSFTPALFKSNPLLFCHTIMSYSFMHGSLKHVAFNMIWLLVFGTPLVRHLGSLRFLIFWALTAIVSVLTYFVLHQDSMIPLVGASGAVSGMMGAIARYGFSQIYFGINAQNEKPLGPLLSIKKSLRSKGVLTYICVWLIVDVMIGVFSFLFAGDAISIAWEAHIGGFFAGFLGIGFFDISRKKQKIMT
ncbi:rhomboid family intramembrane serine protease [Bartonella raoultii]|uniref:Rhomboid family intramembrane serine protease n=1 Tax=Bartonella raoultii TaxID=1457020 RepID=A0ABS7I6Z1_9HYPH|nr:rhomboid family intramembrane serine protease [Bartonella raoultii]MBX4336235.1 rhomboid family intramembrane serine protease [Bartonella raoultii]